MLDLIVGKEKLKIEEKITKISPILLPFDLATLQQEKVRV